MSLPQRKPHQPGAPADPLAAIQDLCRTLEISLLADFISREPVQVGALLLSLSPASVATTLVKRQRPERAAELLLSIATMEPVANEAIETLHEALTELHKSPHAGRHQRWGGSGAERVAPLLAALDSATRAKILERLKDEDLLRDLQRHLLTVSMLAGLARADLGRVLAGFSEQILALGLVLESKQVRQAFCQALSSSRAACLRDELDSLDGARGRIRRKDVDEAAAAIVAKAQALHSEGTLVFPWEDELV